MKSGIYLGCDPGSSNYGYTYAYIGPKSLRIVSCGMVRATINNLTDKEVKPPKSQIRKTKPTIMRAPFMHQLEQYCGDWQESLTEHSPIAITCERYQSRRMGGATIEHVLTMNGALAVLALSLGIDVDFITAATWKFQINRVSDLEAIYKEVSIPDHIVDSAFISLYGALKLNNIPWTEHYVDLLFNSLMQLEL